MRVRFAIVLYVWMLFAVSACSVNPISALTSSATRNQIAPTATPIDLQRANAESFNRPLTKACTLVTQQDLGGFFGAETSQPLYQLNQTNQVIFPAAPVSATEYYCLYMSFHLPSSKNGVYYQVTYWVDTPDKVTPGEWAQTWTEGESHATQSISGVGDGAFYSDGRLTFKKGTTYVTVEVISTKIDTGTPAGVNQQIDIEKRVALTALSRMTN